MSPAATVSPDPRPLTPAEHQRYGRQIALPALGEEGQRRLRAGHVLLVGAGGLGSPAAIYLAAAGVGRLTVVDFDRVETSNLHRQPLYGTSAIGLPKVDAARQRLADLNPHVEVSTVGTGFTRENALDLVAACDLVVDGSDNFATRYLVNDACVLTGRANVYASVLRFEGQLSVLATEHGPCYRCLFPEPPPPVTVPNCAEAGVLGVLPGIMGTLQALEAIKLLTGVGDAAVGRLLLMDAERLVLRSVAVRRDPSCPACGARTLTALQDYDALCGVGPACAASEEPGTAGSAAAGGNGSAEWDGVRELHPAVLAARLAAGEPLAVVDVREPWEWNVVHLPGARHMPLGTFARTSAELDPALEIVLYCHHGMRSLAAANYLADRGFRRLWNLAGGIERYALEGEPGLPRY